jgi:hypothetical protein
MRRGQATFANLLLDVDRDWLILRLDAEHNRLGDFIGRIAPEVGNVRRRVDHLPGLHDLGAQTLDLKGLLALDHESELMAIGVPVQREPESGAPVGRKDQDLLPGEVLKGRLDDLLGRVCRCGLSVAIRMMPIRR